MPLLIITVVNAENIKNVKLIGTQDPYVEIRTDRQRGYTQADNNGGTNPGIQLFSCLTL